MEFVRVDDEFIFEWSFDVYVKRLNAWNVGLKRIMNPKNNSVCPSDYQKLQHMLGFTDAKLHFAGRFYRKKSTSKWIRSIVNK